MAWLVARRISCGNLDDDDVEGASTLTTYTRILDLTKDAELPADGILNRTIFQDDKFKAVDCGSGQDREISEHTATKPAMLFFLKGDASVCPGDDMKDAQAGTWVHMPVSLEHFLEAKTSVVMRLVLLK